MNVPLGQQVLFHCTLRSAVLDSANIKVVFDGKYSISVGRRPDGQGENNGVCVEEFFIVILDAEKSMECEITAD